MNRAGKFPTALSGGEDIMGKVTEIRSTIKFQLKKVLCMGCCVGHVEMSAEDLKYVIVFLLSALPLVQVEHHTRHQFSCIPSQEKLAEFEVSPCEVNDGEGPTHLLTGHSVHSVAKCRFPSDSGQFGHRFICFRT